MEFEETPGQGDLFVCEVVNWPIKDDLASMDFPLFSLAKQRDTREREYRLGAKVVRIIPSVAGAATVFDKDLLLYISSQIVEALNLGQPVSRTVQITTIDFLVSTDRGDGRASFERILDMLRRLRGTTIETNIPTGDVIQTKGFSMIDDYDILQEKTRTAIRKNKTTQMDEEYEATRVFSFKVTISEWLYNSLVSKAILTLDPGYFKLSSSTERRLYEIARKYCGDKPMWKINIDLLGSKLGTGKERFKVRELLREVIASDTLPQYRLALDTNASPDWVVVYTRSTSALYSELIRTNSYEWFKTLESYDNRDTWQSESIKNKITPKARKQIPANEDA